jgi:hypothetical protein
MKSDPPRKPLFGDATMMYATVTLGGVVAAIPVLCRRYAVAGVDTRRGTPISRRARVLARTSRRAAQQEPR